MTLRYGDELEPGEIQGAPSVPRIVITAGPDGNLYTCACGTDYCPGCDAGPRVQLTTAPENYSTHGPAEIHAYARLMALAAGEAVLARYGERARRAASEALEQSGQSLAKEREARRRFEMWAVRACIALLTKLVAPTARAALLKAHRERFR